MIDNFLCLLLFSSRQPMTSKNAWIPAQNFYFAKLLNKFIQKHFLAIV